MDKSLADFLAGMINAVRVEVIISRDIAPNGMHFIHVRPCDCTQDILQAWQNPKKPPRLGNEGPPKHIGGKKPYVMVMTQEVEALRAQGIKNAAELVGSLVLLGGNIEWSTGRLIHKRTKKSLKHADLYKIIGCGPGKFNRILADLKEKELIYRTGKGYFIATRLIRRGKPQNKEAVRDGL